MSALTREQQLVGQLILTPPPPELPDVLRLRPDDFSEPEARTIYGLARRIHDNSGIISGESLRAEGDASFGGDFQAMTEYMADALCEVSTPVGIGTTARLIREAAKARQLERAMGDAKAGLADGLSVDEVYKRLQARTAMIEPEDRGPTVQEIMDAIVARATGPATDELAGLATGFPSLDDIVGGLRSGEVAIVAARTGQGKSTFALNTALNVVRSGGCVALYSLEMPRQHVLERVLAAATGLPAWRLTTGGLDGHDADAVRQAAADVMASGLIIRDNARSAADIHADLTRLATTAPVDLAVVDYLGLLVGYGGTTSRYEAVSAASWALKRLAMDHDVPVLAAHQLNRETAQSNQPPDLHHLRDSGAIEQDAAVVVMIDNPTEYAPSDIYVRKNRHGATGQTCMDWDRATYTFRDGGSSAAACGF